MSHGPAPARRRHPCPSTLADAPRGAVRPTYLAEALEGRLLPSAYTVTTLGDEAGSVAPVPGQDAFTATTLRAALGTANARAGADAITFAPTVAGTINLRTALPRVTDDLTITSPGPSDLTVRRDLAASADFPIFSIASGNTAALSGLTISGGTRSGIVNAGTLTVSNATVSGNSGGRGGGIFNEGTLTITDTTLSGDAATGGFDQSRGGGIFNAEGGILKVVRSTLLGNSGGFGGGIYNEGTLTVTDSTLTGNSATGIFNGSGGGICNFGRLTVTHSTLSGNSATFNSGFGGGISNLGTVSVVGCTLLGNSAQSGGGIGWGGTGAITNSTLSGNSAEFGGGGIFVSTGTLALTNSTLAGNSANGEGGGINNNYPGGTLTVTHSTVSGNSAAAIGGGIVSLSETPAVLSNSIVAGNIGGDSATSDDIYNAFIAPGVPGTLSPSSSFNLIGTGGPGGLQNGVNGNQVGVAGPRLGPLADNGGPTQTMALLPGSPALDAGSNELAVGPDGPPLATDQRGLTRPAGVAVDIGAFEHQPPPGGDVPEVTVSEGATPLTGGAAAIDFGTVTRNAAPPTRSFTVRNAGFAPLTLGPPALPAGFTLAEGLSPTIGPGDGDTFQVALDTASAGAFSGSVTIPTNDPARSPFAFALTGAVSPLSARLDVGGVQAVVVGGQANAGGRATLVVTNASDAPVAGPLAVTLLASAEGEGGGADLPVGSAMARVRLRPGRAKSIPVAITFRDPPPSDGDYALRAVITLGGDLAGEAAAARTVRVEQPRVDLAGASSTPPAGQEVRAFAYGKRASLSVPVTNRGNVPAKGTVTLDLTASADGSPEPGRSFSLGSVAGVRASAKPGQTKPLRFNFRVPETFPEPFGPGGYFLIVRLSSSSLGAANASDGQVLATIPFTIS